MDPNQVNLITLNKSDFCSIDNLPPIPPIPEPKSFINEKWLCSQVDKVMEHYNSGDGNDTLQRVPPMAIVAHSGAGKTRSLLEIAQILQKKDIPVIYITFNFKTYYKTIETSQPIDSVLSRIAYAIAKPSSVKGLDFHKIDKLQFVTSKGAIVDWLGESPCILCIDELSNLIRPNCQKQQMEKEIGSFLKDYFLTKRRRYFIFSSHFRSTTKQLKDYMGSPSRPVEIAGLPVFTSPDEVSQMFNHIPDSHPMYYGNSPGLYYTCTQMKTENFAESKVEELLDHGYFKNNVLAQEIIENIFSGALQLKEYDIITRISNSTKIWIPCFLYELLRQFKFPDLPAEYAVQAKGLLLKLKSEKLHSGLAWEKVVLCALYFRILEQRFPKHSSCGDWFPTIPSAAEFKIIVDYPEQDFETVIQNLSLPKASAVVTLSYPKESSFPIYDLFVTVNPGDHLPVVIFGYQCKAGDLPSQEPHPLVNNSIVLRSENINPNTNSNAFKNGWKIASTEDRFQLLGPSFDILRLTETPSVSIDQQRTSQNQKNRNNKHNNTIEDNNTKKRDRSGELIENEREDSTTKKRNTETKKSDEEDETDDLKKRPPTKKSARHKDKLKTKHDKLKTKK